MIILTTSLVLFVNIGADRPNVNRSNVCAFFCVLWCSVSLSLICHAAPSSLLAQLIG